MTNFFKEARIVPAIVGNIKRIPIMRKLLPVSTGGSNNARYCYSVWLRHLHFYWLNGGKVIPVTVAELGPGDSLGIGLAAILSGVMKYYAFDIQHYWNTEKNVKIFDDLVELFEVRNAIPDEVEFPNVSPKLDLYSFPEKILTEKVLIKSLDARRVKAIRKELMNPDDPSNKFITYQVPWHDSSIIEKQTVDLIISQAVLEHIDDLDGAYRTMILWLNDGGLISHSIDFKCHGMTKSWNGHWSLSKAEWGCIRGGRIYAINRQPLSVHMSFLDKYGFNVLDKQIKNMTGGISRKDVASEFRHLSDEDMNTSGVYIIAGKKITTT